MLNNFVFFAFYRSSKPERGIFDWALDACGAGMDAAAPGDACHVGDDPDKDYFGAVGAGWGRALLLDREGKLKEDGIPKAHICADFEGVYRTLRSDGFL